MMVTAPAVMIYLSSLAGRKTSTAMSCRLFSPLQLTSVSTIGPSSRPLLAISAGALDPRILPELRREHTGVPERDRQRNCRARVVDGRVRAKPLEQRRRELEHRVREVVRGHADHGP
jgi:hypothetical protein